MAQIEVYFPENNQVSFDFITILSLGFTSFPTSSIYTPRKNIDTRADGNRRQSKFETSKEASILLTLPFDMGMDSNH